MRPISEHVTEIVAGTYVRDGMHPLAGFLGTP